MKIRQQRSAWPTSVTQHLPLSTSRHLVVCLRNSLGFLGYAGDDCTGVASDRQVTV